MTHGSTTQKAAQYLKGFVAFRLAPGIAWSQLWVLVAILLASRVALEFINLMQPFVLNEQLHIPREQQGRVTGAIGMAQQLVLLITIGFAGVLTDRYGRRVMMIFAMFGLVFCCFAFPLIGSLAMLVVLRMVYGLVMATYNGGAGPLIHDFSHPESRGRFWSFIVVVQLAGVALVVGFTGAHLPSWLIDAGFSTLQAGQLAFAVFGLIALAGLYLAWAKLRDPPINANRGAARMGVRQIFLELRAVLAYGRENPRFGMLIVLSFVTRADNAVVAAFLSLWVVNAGALQGMSTAQATVVAGSLLMILQVASFVMPPIFGALADRWDRAPLLLFALLVGGLAFITPAFLADPFGWEVIVVVILIGMADGAQTVAAQAMFGDEAPPQLRGSAFGLFTVFGTVSVLVVTAAGGFLFDKMGYGAPFALVGVLNFALLAIIYVWLKLADRRKVEIANL